MKLLVFTLGTALVVAQATDNFPDIQGVLPDGWQFIGKGECGREQSCEMQYGCVNDMWLRTTPPNATAQELEQQCIEDAVAYGAAGVSFGLVAGENDGCMLFPFSETTSIKPQKSAYGGCPAWYPPCQDWAWYNPSGDQQPIIGVMPRINTRCFAFFPTVPSDSPSTSPNHEPSTLPIDYEYEHSECVDETGLPATMRVEITCAEAMMRYENRNEVSICMNEFPYCCVTCKEKQAPVVDTCSGVTAYGDALKATGEDQTRAIELCQSLPQCKTRVEKKNNNLKKCKRVCNKVMDEEICEAPSTSRPKMAVDCLAQRKKTNNNFQKCKNMRGKAPRTRKPVNCDEKISKKQCTKTVDCTWRINTCVHI